MIARILFNAGSSMKSTNWLADVHERLIVASASKSCCGHVDAVLGEVLHKELLDRSRTGGTSQVESAAISIEDTEVPARYHVEIEVCEDTVGF